MGVNALGSVFKKIQGQTVEGLLSLGRVSFIKSLFFSLCRLPCVHATSLRANCKACWVEYEFILGFRLVLTKKKNVYEMQLGNLPSE